MRFQVRRRGTAHRFTRVPTPAPAATRPGPGTCPGQGSRTGTPWKGSCRLGTPHSQRFGVMLLFLHALELTTARAPGGAAGGGSCTRHSPFAEDDSNQVLDDHLLLTGCFRLRVIALAMGVGSGLATHCQLPWEKDEVTHGHGWMGHPNFLPHHEPIEYSSALNKK